MPSSPVEGSGFSFLRAGTSDACERVSPLLLESGHACRRSSTFHWVNVWFRRSGFTSGIVPPRGVIIDALTVGERKRERARRRVERERDERTTTRGVIAGANKWDIVGRQEREKERMMLRRGERERQKEQTSRLTGIIYSALIHGRARRRASDEYQAALRQYWDLSRLPIVRSGENAWTHVLDEFLFLSLSLSLSYLFIYSCFRRLYFRVNK